MNNSIVIIGATASGKSAVAIEIARQFDGEIISADSRQIFRDMDIGTGKVSRDVDEPIDYVPRARIAQYLQPYFSGGIAHYMIDIVAPTTLYNVAKFVRFAQKIRADIWRRDKLPIICGGTGFWAQALAENQTFPNIPPNQKLRAKLELVSTVELFAQLEKINPSRAENIAQKNEQSNRVRLIRAIEVAQSSQITQKPKSLSFPRGNDNLSQNLNNSNTIIIAITPPKEELHAKIATRFDQWIADGLLDEIQMLHNQLHISWKRLESFGLEYKWGVRYVRGQCTRDDMRENTLRDLRKYAKRQLTWIRRWQHSNTNIHTATTPTEAIQIAQKLL